MVSRQRIRISLSKVSYFGICVAALEVDEASSLWISILSSDPLLSACNCGDRSMDPYTRQTRPPNIYQGYSNDFLRIKERNNSNRAQSLNFSPQGYATFKPSPAQEPFIADDPRLDSDEFGDLIQLGCLNPEFYRPPIARAVRRTLADEKLQLQEKNAETNPVIRFYAYQVDALPQEKPFLKENYRVRKFILYVYTVDNSIRVWENREKNSGFTQGDYLRRGRYEIPGKEGFYYRWFDLDVGVDIELAGHKFHIYDADDYGRHFFEYNGASIKKAEEVPADPYFKWRAFMEKHREFSRGPTEFPTSRFIRTDGQVLCFEVIVDESIQKHGDIRRMVLKYYVYDDTLELLQLWEKNSGYDPARAVIRRQKIPKDFFNDLVLQIGDKTTPNHYTVRDLKIGETLLFFGKKVTICDCDEYTRNWYRDNLAIVIDKKIDASTLLPVQPPVVTPPLPPWNEKNRQGTYIDSLQNCLHLDPQPVIIDYKQQMWYQHEELRFEARMLSREPSDQNRIFLFIYYVSDDTLAITEKPQRDLPGGVFLSRGKLPKPRKNDHEVPTYYTERDFTIGSVHNISGRLFEIYNCDLHVINFAQQNPDCYSPEEIERFREAISRNNSKPPPLEYTEHAIPSDSVDERVKKAVLKLKRWLVLSHERLYQIFLELDHGKTEEITLDILLTMFSQLGIAPDEDIAKGVFETLTAREGQYHMPFTRFLHGVNVLWSGARPEGPKYQDVGKLGLDKYD